MRLEKWYADIVDRGVASIHYCAELQIGPMRFGYKRRILHNGTESSTLRFGRGDLPCVEHQRLVWPGLNSPQWHECGEHNHTLWKVGGRCLSWNPVVLNGSVEGPGLSQQARGYAERLVLNFGPWHLGMGSLKWGRFCGESCSLVWIEWIGKIPKQLALLNGAKCEVEQISELRVSCRGASLELAEPRLLVREPISSAAKALSPVFGYPGVLRFLSGLEMKWLASAKLELANGQRDTGFAIFEQITWPV
jgi:hypothetical protein